MGGGGSTPDGRWVLLPRSLIPYLRPCLGKLQYTGITVVCMVLALPAPHSYVRLPLEYNGLTPATQNPQHLQLFKGGSRSSAAVRFPQTGSFFTVDVSSCSYPTTDTTDRVLSKEILQSLPQMVRGYKLLSSSVVFHRSIWPQTLHLFSTYTSGIHHIKRKKEI